MSSPPPARQCEASQKNFLYNFDFARATNFFFLKGKESFSARLRAQPRGAAGLHLWFAGKAWRGSRGGSALPARQKSWVGF